MRKTLVAAALMVGAFLGGITFGQHPSARAYVAAVEFDCTEDMPCWRAWHGNGNVGPDAPAYMFLPEGAWFDALAPLFGYVSE